MNKLRILLLMITLAIRQTDLFAQKYYMSAPEGFGAGTTGGGSASPVTVTNYDDLVNAWVSTSPAVILVSGTIDFTNKGIKRALITNKTLVGLPGAKLVNTNQSASGIFYLSSGSNNVIIRNLIFEGPGAWDNNGQDNLTADGCTKLWVDHCEFQDGEDGNFDNKGNTDNVTVSWCKFTYLKATRKHGAGTTDDHRFTNLIGSDADDAPADKHYSITWQSCYWADGCKERMPRARNAELHILNCYHKTNVTGSLALGLGGGTLAGGIANSTSCYVENCNFAQIGTIYKPYSGDGGTVGVAFSGCLPTNPAPVGTPPSKPSYNYSVYPASNVATYVPDPACGAGATLNVTANGVISSACFADGLASGDTEESGGSFVYPNPGSGSFMLRGREQIKSISIMDLNGITVYTSNHIQAGKSAEISADLGEGVYVIKLQNVSGTTEAIKYVRSK